MSRSTNQIMKRVLRGSVTLAILMPAAALAQQATGDTQLQQITVEGNATGGTATGPVDGYVGKTSAAGSKSETPVSEIPQSVSVIGRTEMDSRGATTKIDEVLRYTPGVTAEPYGVDADTDWYYIRGFQATQTGVFLDGLNLFSYGFGGFQMDAFMLERVDVLKGPASVLYGGSNPGGIIDLISKRPQDEPVRYTEIGINNFGNSFVGFDIGDKIDAEGVWKYRITGKVAGGDNYTDYSEDLRGILMPQITWEPDAKTSITLHGYFSALDQVHSSNGFLPYEGTVVNAPFGKIDRKAFFGEPDLDNGRYYQSMVGYEAKHELENGWEISQNARYGHLYKHEEGPYPWGYTSFGAAVGPNYDIYRIGFEATSKADTFNIDTRARKEFEAGGATHDLLVGLDYKYYSLDHIQACCGATSISATNPVYGAQQGANFVYLNEVVTQQQVGVYAQDQIRFGGGWLATLNGRYDFVDTDVKYRLTNTRISNNDGQFSGRAGLAYEFDNGVTPYVSAATFFNPLVGTTGAGTPVVPEKGHQFEAGVKYAPTFIDGLFTASVFQLTKENSVVSDIFGISTQIGEVQSTGVELEAKVNIDENWKATAGLTYTDLEVTKHANPALVGKSPYIVPDTTASLWLDYTVTEGALEGLGLGAGVRYQGKSWADEANTLRVPSAAVFDAGIRYEKNDWTASLNVANLFDNEYVKSCGGASVCGYGEARTVTFKLSKKW